MILRLYIKRTIAATGLFDKDCPLQKFATKPFRNPILVWPRPAKVL